jgi:multisubunit Na+/H+ antiporter MnhB subunit
VGGLLAASAVTLYALAFSAEAARRMLRLDPRAWIGIGLVTAIVSGMPALVFGQPFLTGRWVSVPTPGFDDPIKLGTPLLFDIGVYFTVLGVVLLMVLSLEEVRHERALGD